MKPEKVQVGEDFELIISFTNSLPHQLKDSVFHIESPGIAGPFVLESKYVCLKFLTYLCNISVTVEAHKNYYIITQFY